MTRNKSPAAATSPITTPMFGRSLLDELEPPLLVGGASDFGGEWELCSEVLDGGGGGEALLPPPLPLPSFPWLFPLLSLCCGGDCEGGGGDCDCEEGIEDSYGVGGGEEEFSGGGGDCSCCSGGGARVGDGGGGVV